MNYITSGNSVVDAMGMMNFTGNVTPQVWYSTITRENGKPYLLAITLLADIVYWYRPVEVRDQQSGRVTGWKKRFHGDLLQKTYQQYADLYGESKRSVKAALDRLEELGVIKKVFRDVPYENGLVMYNLMYIALDAEMLRNLTYPEEITAAVTENRSESAEEGTCKITQGVVHNFVGGGTTECNSLPQQKVPEGTTTCRTNTEITTESTNINSIHPICQDVDDKMDGINTLALYKQRIKNNIYYEALVQDRSTQISQINEIVDLMVEVVVVPRVSIRINGADYPYEMVRRNFLNLNYFHVCYALDCLQDNRADVKNIRAYLLTTLYNAASTLENFYQCKVNHDMIRNSS